MWRQWIVLGVPAAACVAGFTVLAPQFARNTRGQGEKTTYYSQPATTVCLGKP